MESFNLKELVEKLDIAKAALSKSDQIEDFVYFWFDGDFVYAFDNVLGIRIPMKLGIRGGIRGSLLLGILSKLTAEEVQFQLEDENIAFYPEKENSKFSFPVKPFEDFEDLWMIDEPKWDSAFKITKDVYEAITSILFSVGDAKIMHPEQKGVTLLQESSDEVEFYSTDEKTISRVIINIDGAMFSSLEFDQCIFPTPFCEQLKKLGDPESMDGLLSVDDSCVYFLRDDGLFIFSRLVENEDPVDFRDLIGKTLKDESYIEIPDKFFSAIDKAAFLTEKTESFNSTMRFADGVLSIIIETPFSGMIENIALKHKDIEIKFDPAILLRGISTGKRTHFYVIDGYIVIKGPENFCHSISLK